MRCTRCSFLFLALAVLLFGAATCTLAQAATQNVLTWQDNSANEQSFDIERKAVPCATAGTFTVLATVGANVVTYTDLAVTEGATYCYRVDAANTAGKSGYSNTAERLVPFTVPAAPSVLGVTGGP
jgi:hypothetical protein